MSNTCKVNIELRTSFEAYITQYQVLKTLTKLLFQSKLYWGLTPL